MSEKKYMQIALELAARAAGRTTPNPPVGAVVVREGEVVGQGFHPEAGKPHAEIYALEEAGDAAAGSTLYVTLEPCNHTGRTGPCTEAIISSGIRTVVVGTIDPNPKVAGTGIQRLKDAGISVLTGVMADECKALIAPFAKHVTTGLPYVTLKMAMTLDGQTATSSGESQWISCAESREYVHLMRDKSDAIMVGVGTLLEDDPKLTTRLPGGEGKDPVRIVVDSKLRTPSSAQVLSVDSAATTIIATTENSSGEDRARLLAAGAEVVVVESDEQGIDLHALMSELGRRNIQSVLLEGGATLAGAAIRSGVVDKVAFFIAPKIFGGDDGKLPFAGSGCNLLADAVTLKSLKSTKIGDDVLIEGEFA